MSGADNQQERLDGYISGYVDGETALRSPSIATPDVDAVISRFRSFHVSQNGDRAQALGLIRERFGGCGYIKSNGRRDRALVYAVRRRQELIEHLIPFVERSPLLSSKHEDFAKFAAIVRSMSLGHHGSPSGFSRLLDDALSMNGEGRFRSVRWKGAHRKPSRILRDCTPNAKSDAFVKIQSELHGDMQSQAEMTWPTATCRGNKSVGPYLPWALEN